VPSQEHALLVDLFRATPSLALESLRANGFRIPAVHPRLLDPTFPVPSPDYHVDLAVACDDEQGEPRVVVLVEVQLKVDRGKRLSWPLYQAAARAHFKCPACVLVVAIKPRVARWASAPVALGPGGSVFRPVVLGPAQLGRAPSAPTPELTVLSALAHGAHQPETIRLAVASIAQLEAGRAAAYFDLLRYHLGKALDRALEAIMATSEHKYLSDFARKYYDDGEAKGTRASLLTVVKARGVSLRDDERARIDACTDVATLETWLVRAARATRAEEIFTE
jgi:hypothetical protein